MAKTACWFPAWTETLDAAIADDGKIRMLCTKCGKSKLVDLVALREKLGGSYSLINKRTRCRLTPGCDGWNRPRYLHGVYRPLWDDATGDRWMTS